MGGAISLSTLSADYTAQDGEILTGTLGAHVKISIADGAKVTLRDAAINGVNDYKFVERGPLLLIESDYPWAGLTCEGNATIFLEGTNSVRGFYQDYPGIYVPPERTLTITGDGELTASSNGFEDDFFGGQAAGIGGGPFRDCGNIVIEGGTITATGGYYGAGIGSGFQVEGGFFGRCGDITIKDTVTKVKATRGEKAQHSIGAGCCGRCGTVTIGDDVGSRSEPTCTYPPNK